MKINEQIAYLRRERGMTQEQLATALGVTNQSVSKWESGQNCPDIQLLPEIASFFGVTIDSLMGHAEPGSLSDMMLRLRQHLSETPADKAFESSYRLASLLHEAAMTYGYSIDAHWKADKDYAAEAMDKWGLSLMNDAGAGCSGRNSRGIFFALSGAGDMPDAYQLKRMADQLSQLADADVLRVLFALAMRGEDEYATIDELAQATGLDDGAVKNALFEIQTEAQGGAYRLDERMRHIPALISFLMPM